MVELKKVARPFVNSGWELRPSGLRRRDESGHWAHFWLPSYGTRKESEPLLVCPSSGTVSPYLLRVYDVPNAEAPPRANFIAASSQLTPLEYWVNYLTDGASSGEPLDQFPRQRWLSSSDVAPWLDARIADHLPRLVNMSSDAGLLQWLSASDQTANLRNAALLAHHLRLDDQVDDLLSRAEAAQARQDANFAARGIERANHDRQTRYPQDWSHQRFCKFLRAAPID